MGAPLAASCGRRLAAAATGGRADLALERGRPRGRGRRRGGPAPRRRLASSRRPCAPRDRLQVEISKYSFLRSLLERIDRVGGYPRLRRGFESSLDRLYFLGAPSAWSYGPLMRFVAGTEFAAPTLTRGILDVAAPPVGAARPEWRSGASLSVGRRRRRQRMHAPCARSGRTLRARSSLAPTTVRSAVVRSPRPPRHPGARALRRRRHSRRQIALRDRSRATPRGRRPDPLAVRPRGAVGIAGWVLFPTADESAAVVARSYNVLAERFVLASPPWETFRWAYDKRLSHELAARAGVPHPRTWSVRSAEEAARLDVGFPLIIKPAVKESFNALTVAKAWRVDSRAELQQRFAEAEQLLPVEFLMIQELIPGSGKDGDGEQLSYAALCRRGEPLAQVVARRTRSIRRTSVARAPSSRRSRIRRSRRCRGGCSAISASTG